MMTLDRCGADRWVRTLPRLIFLSTALLLGAGVAASAAWWTTGEEFWLRSFFSYPGALFLIGCSLLQLWLSFLCWTRFSSGDLLRPAWFLITLASLSQAIGGIIHQVFGIQSYLNPLAAFPPGLRYSLTEGALQISELFSPLYMALLACGLAYLLRACRESGILGRLKTVDVLLLGIVIVYTASFFTTIVFSPEHGGRKLGLHAVISWSSDPLLCLLLFQAILIRRSTANMGWGLISRCWISFTAAIFLTSIGDIGLWALSKGYLPRVLQVASWYVWFLASAAYILGPAYQLQAMVLATCGEPASSVTSAR